MCPIAVSSRSLPVQTQRGERLLYRRPVIADRRGERGGRAHSVNLNFSLRALAETITPRCSEFPGAPHLEERSFVKIAVGSNQAKPDQMDGADVATGCSRGQRDPECIYNSSTSRTK